MSYEKFSNAFRKLSRRWTSDMMAVSRTPESIRRYVIKLQSVAFFYLQNKFIEVSRECAVFILRVQAELIGELKNVNHIG